MKLIERDVAPWVSEKLGVSIHPPYISFAVEDQFYTLRGGVILNDWNGANIEITLYCPGAYRRELAKQVFEYVFRQLECKRLTARTRHDNKDMQKMLDQLGFEREGTMKNYFAPGVDAHIYRLDPDRAERWMK